MKFIWLDVRDAMAFHAQQIALFGGQAGVRDQGLLESAIARPRNLSAYRKATVFEVAAGYAYGIVRNHPFLDGNKRVALVCAFVFLDVNGWEVDAPEAEAAVQFYALAEGSLSEAELAAWMKKHASKRTD